MEMYLKILLAQHNKNYYVSHYTENTPIQKGKSPGVENILAHQSLINEMGLEMCGSIFIEGKGVETVWSGPDLDYDEMEILCIRKLSEREIQQVRSL